MLNVLCSRELRSCRGFVSFSSVWLGNGGIQPAPRQQEFSQLQAYQPHLLLSLAVTGLLLAAKAFLRDLKGRNDTMTVSFDLLQCEIFPKGIPSRKIAKVEFTWVCIYYLYRQLFYLHSLPGRWKSFIKSFLFNTLKIHSTPSLVLPFPVYTSTGTSSWSGVCKGFRCSLHFQSGGSDIDQ